MKSQNARAKNQGVKRLNLILRLTSSFVVVKIAIDYSCELPHSYKDGFYFTNDMHDLPVSPFPQIAFNHFIYNLINIFLIQYASVFYAVLSLSLSLSHSGLLFF